MEKANTTSKRQITTRHLICFPCMASNAQHGRYCRRVCFKWLGYYGLTDQACLTAAKPNPRYPRRSVVSAVSRGVTGENLSSCSISHCSSYLGVMLDRKLDRKCQYFILQLVLSPFPCCFFPPAILREKEPTCFRVNN